MTRLLLLAITCCALCGMPLPGRAQDRKPAWTSRANDLVEPLLEKHPRAAVAIQISTSGRPPVFLGYGRVAPAELLPTTDTLFQIGSVTKLFTSLLLAIAVEKRELQLTDPASRLLPPELVLPRRGDREITLEELATHTSGLPRLPPNFNRATMSGKLRAIDPYGGIDASMLAEGLAECQLKDEDLPAYRYSNLGAGLLGLALCRQAGTDYETLQRQRITLPLGMPDTVISLSESQRSRFARGHNSAGKEIPDWKFGMLEGAGALSSTVSDLQRFLDAEAGRADSPLAKAILLSQQPRRQAGDRLQIGLAWHISGEPEHRFWWHNGATYGHSSFVAFCRDPAVTVIVLCNQGFDPLTSGTLADRIGFPLLRGLIDAETGKR